MSGSTPFSEDGRQFVIDELDEVLVLHDRPMSAEHLDAFVAWSQRRPPDAEREASSRSAEERLLRQLCGRAVATSSPDDAALAVKVVFQHGAWVGPPDRDRLWVNFNFPAWAAAQLGLDPGDFLLNEAGRLGHNYRDIVQGVLRYIAADSLVDWRDRRYAAVRNEAGADLVHRWSYDLHDQIASSTRAWMARTNNAEPAPVGSAGRGPGWELPWLEPGVPVHDATDPLAADRDALDRLLAASETVAAGSSATPPSATSLAAESVAMFVAERSTFAAVTATPDAAAQALRLAAMAQPRLVPAVLYAAKSAPVPLDRGWVEAAVATLTPQQQHVIQEALSDGGEAGPWPFVATGVRRGPSFSLPLVDAGGP